MANVVAPFGKFILAALLFNVIAGCQQNNPSADAQQPQGTPVCIARAETTMVEDLSEFVGNLEARRFVALRPQIDGQIVQILVEPGDRTGAGTLVVQLNPNRSQSDLASADARIKAAIASRENALAELRAQEAQRVADRADVRLQQEEFRRTTMLVTEGALSQQDLDRAISNRDTAIAQLGVTEQRIRAAQATLAEQNALLRAAQEEAGSVSEDVADTRILSPFAGMIGDIPVKVGDYVETEIPSPPLLKMMSWIYVSQFLWSKDRIQK